MAQANVQKLKQEIAGIGRNLYTRFLVVGRSGNISCRCGRDSILITATGTALAALSPSDIVRVGLNVTHTPFEITGRRPSSELPLHRSIYRSLPCRCVIHCHPPLTNAYFALYPALKELIHETRFVLGEVPVIPQQSVNVEDPLPVIAALKSRPLAVLQNHGVVAVADSFADAFALIETLESAVYVAAVARLFKPGICDGLDAAVRRRMRASSRKK